VDHNSIPHEVQQSYSGTLQLALCYNSLAYAVDEAHMPVYGFCTPVADLSANMQWKDGGIPRVVKVGCYLHERWYEFFQKKFIKWISVTECMPGTSDMSIYKSKSLLCSNTLQSFRMSPNFPDWNVESITVVPTLISMCQRPNNPLDSLFSVSAAANHNIPKHLEDGITRRNKEDSKRKNPVRRCDCADCSTHATNACLGPLCLSCVYVLSSACHV